MVSSIYAQNIKIKYLGKVSSYTVTDGGSDYMGESPDASITAPDATQATASTELIEGKVSVINIGVAGSGYDTDPTVTLSAPDSLTQVTLQATAVSSMSDGEIVSLTITNPGSGYKSAPTVAIAAPIILQASATVNVVGDVVQTVTVNEAGKGYVSAPTVTIDDPPSGTTAKATANISTIDANTNMLTNDIQITTEEVTPGGGAVLRILFSVEYSGAAIGDFEIFNDGNFKGRLNADNATNIVSQGYYRFDIDGEAGDKINFKSSSPLKIDFLRVHVVLLGT